MVSAVALLAPSEIPPLEYFACAELPGGFAPPAGVGYALHTTEGSYLEGNAPYAPWASQSVTEQTFYPNVYCYTLPQGSLYGTFSISVTAPALGEHVLYFGAAVSTGSIPTGEAPLFFPLGRRLAVPGPAHYLDHWQEIGTPVSGDAISNLAFTGGLYYAATFTSSVYTSATGEDL